MLALPAGGYGPLSWGPSGLYTGYEPSAKDTSTATLDRIDPLTNRIANVGPPPPAGCTATNDLPGAVGADGTIEIIRTCEMIVGTAVGPFTADSVSFNVATGQVSELAPLGDFSGPPPLWEPGHRRGWVSLMDSGVCFGIAQITPRGLIRVARPVTLGGVTWELDAPFFQGHLCHGNQGNSWMPALSPDGRQLAFLASPDDAGSANRGSSSWNLYVRTTPDGPPRQVAGGFSHVGGTSRYSPDGRFVVLNASYHGHDEEWIVDVRTGHRRPLEAASMGSVAFSPDGTQLAAVVPAKNGDPLADNRVAIFHLGSLRDF